MWSKVQRSVNVGPNQKLEGDLVCLLIALGRRCQPGDGIVEHYANEEDQKYPAQWPDFPSGVHAASLGMPIRCACASLRRGFQHREQCTPAWRITTRKSCLGRIRACVLGIW
jgi:hypothetical protein